MSDKFRTVMNSVDDAILEEAFVPVKKKRSYRGIALTAAACLVIALGVTLTQGLNMKGENPDVEHSMSLPQDEILALADSENSQLSFLINETEYLCQAVKTSEMQLPSDSGEGDVLSWNYGGVDIFLSSSSSGTSVSWYVPDEDTQWYLSAQADISEVLTTASQILSVIGLDVAVAPANAENVTYNAFLSDGLTVVETTFMLDGITYAYRMAGTYEIEENFADISGMESSFAENSESFVRWCNARLSLDNGGQGKIVWFDVVPGILYSLSVDSGASADMLQNMADSLFDPAQDDIG